MSRRRSWTSKEERNADERLELAAKTLAGRALLTIENMRSREYLKAIIAAAEKRDAHLAQIESDNRRRHSWGKFSHLKVGDTVFIHRHPHKDRAEDDPPSPYIGMWGKALRVKQMKPRAKEIIVDAPGHKTWTLTALVADNLKLSEVPTADAFDNALAGDVSARKV